MELLMQTQRETFETSQTFFASWVRNVDTRPSHSVAMNVCYQLDEGGLIKHRFHYQSNVCAQLYLCVCECRLITS